MIYESYYWKKELYKSFLTLAKFRHLQRTTELSHVNVEKALMIGAYIIRKLDEAQKIPPHFLLKKELLEFSISKGTIVDHLNWHRLDTHFDFDNVTKSDRDWRFIINQIVHSFSLFFSSDDSGRFDGFIINSDKTKKDALIYLPLGTLLRMFLTVSEGDITSARVQRRVLRKTKDKSKFGELRLTSAVYSYPRGFDIDKIISDTMDGDIYKKSANET